MPRVSRSSRARGQLRTAAGLDFEAKPIYAVTITVSDTKGTTTINVTVNVTDVDEPPDAPNAPSLDAATSSSLTVQWVAPANTGKPAISGFDVQYQAEGEASFTPGPQDESASATGVTISGLTPSTTYLVQVRAQNDEGEGAWSTSLSAATVANRNPEFAVSPPTFDVAENTVTDMTVGTAVTATDPDGDDVSHSLTGADADNFAIDDASGQISTSAELNFEAKASHSFSVTASDTYGGSASLAVTVHVTDDDTESPEAPAAAIISEIDSAGFTATWTAPANAGPDITDYDVQYREGSTGPFTAWTHDGPTLTAEFVELDAGTTHEVQVRAKNAEGDSDWSPSATAATLVNAAPVITETTPVREVDENTAAGEGVGAAIEASDADDTDLTYTLSGTDEASFTIVADSGLIQTVDELNFEAKSSHSVTVTVADDQGSHASVDVTINVRDIDEPPAAPEAPTFPSSTQNSLTVSWVEPANTGPAITDYNVQHRVGNSGDFTPATHDGIALTTTITSLTVDTDYEVQVQATNDEGTGDWSASGTGTTVTNEAPVFDETGLVVTVEVTENTGSGENMGSPVTATDSDGGTITYRLEGTDAGSFDIVGTTGQLQTSDPLDFEDASSHSVIVRAADGQGGSVTKDVHISVIDVDEPPTAPGIPTISDPGLTSFTVIWVKPANTGPAITDYDVQYSVGTTESFTAWPHDGTALSTSITGLSQNTSYQVQVLATNDEGSSPWSVAATGGTTVNHGPTFDAIGPLTFAAAENTPSNTPIGSALAATDADNDTLIFSLVGDDASSFDIDSTSGQLLTEAALDFEGDSSYGFTAEVSDGGVESDSISITITVTDEDEAPLAPTVPQLVESSTDSLDIQWVAPANAGRPAIASYDVQYRVTGTTPFTNGPQNVAGTTATISGLEVDTSHDVQVRATNDEGDGSWSQSLVARTSAPPNIPPQFPSDATAVSIAENTEADQAIGAPITATDSDGDTLTYVLEGVNAGLFDIESATGQLLTRAGLDFESDASIDVIVQAADGEGGTDTIVVTVGVTDVDEPPIAPDAPVLSASTSDSLTVGWNAPTNVGRPAIDSYDLRYRLVGTTEYSDGPQEVDLLTATITDLAEDSEYEIQVRARNDEGAAADRTISENTPSGQTIGSPVTATDADADTLTYTLEGTAAGLFDIVSTTGQLQTSAGLDHESNPSHSVIVRVDDGRGGIDTITIAIAVEDVDEPPDAPTSLRQTIHRQLRRTVSIDGRNRVLQWSARCDRHLGDDQWVSS